MTMTTTEERELRRRFAQEQERQHAALDRIEAKLDMILVALQRRQDRRSAGAIE